MDAIWGAVVFLIVGLGIWVLLQWSLGRRRQPRPMRDPESSRRSSLLAEILRDRLGPRN